MARWTPLKRDVLDSLADEFLHNYSRGRTLIAVDGVEGAGTREFADSFAERLGRGSHPVFRASMEDFHRPREEREIRGADSAEGYYRDAFDYDLFRRVLVEPFRLGGSTGFVTAAFDVVRNTQIEMDWKTGPQDATLVVDGPFLNRPELRGLWSSSIWLEGDRPQDAAGVRHPGAHSLYAREAAPRTRAVSIIDDSNPEHPRRVFADSC